MTKLTDQDIKALEAASRALMRSSSRRMLRANMEFLWDRFIGHPTKEVVERFDQKKVAG